MKGIPVLMYHALEDREHPAGAKDQGEQLYVLQVDQFREQMEYLKREGYSTFLLEELQALAVWPDKAVVLTFDDGHESNYTLALPILLEFGFKAHFFITTGWIGTQYFMSEEQIKGLHEAGMGIGSHGVTHRFLSDLTKIEINNELSDSKYILQEIVEKAVEALSFPGGRMNSSTHVLAQNIGYSLVCSSEPCLYKKNGSKLIPRYPMIEKIVINDFIALVEGQGTSLSVLARYKALSTFKCVLGNRFYERLRDALLHLKLDKSSRVSHER